MQQSWNARAQEPPLLSRTGAGAWTKNWAAGPDTDAYRTGAGASGGIGQQRILAASL